MYIKIRLLLLLFLHFSFQFSNIKNFHHTFLRNGEAYKVETSHMWTMGGYMVYTRIRLLLLIHPFISSFFFLSNFQTYKIFITLFSRTVRLTKVGLGLQSRNLVHIDNGWMYRVYRNQLAAYLFLHFSFSSVFKH